MYAIRSYYALRVGSLAVDDKHLRKSPPPAIGEKGLQPRPGVVPGKAVKVEGCLGPQGMETSSPVRGTLRFPALAENRILVLRNNFV